LTVFLTIAGLVIAPHATGQKIAFRRAMELALQHSAGVGVALADQMRARQGYLETRNMYIPQLTFGSGVGQTWGYPMSIEGSAPSIFNVTSQSYLLNFANRDAMRAARTDWHAADLSFENQRQSALLEAALTYLQLEQAGTKLQTLQQESDEAGRLEAISQARLKEGIDSKLDVTRARLNAARLRLRLAEAQGSTDLLRQRLAQLTGLDAREIETDPASVPQPPQIDPHENMEARALANSPAVKAADERARAAELHARSERRQAYPAVDLVANYGLFTKYNNLNLLFPNGQFSRNNATLGIAIRLPFLNAAERSRAAAAEADLLRAQKLAETAREQVASETLRLQRSVQQLEAARDVAQLEQELAQTKAEAAQAEATAGNGTIRDQENARLETSEKRAALLDAQFELDRARLQLLRTTGGLEAWALP
jgi:outer membrane protein TolC